jgi:hypothetical protein
MGFMSTRYPFPARYFLGHLDFVDGTRIHARNTIMFPDGHDSMFVVFLSSNGLPSVTAPKLPNSPLTHIQYAIAALDEDGYKMETLNHPFESETYIEPHGDILFRIRAESGALLDYVPVGDVITDISQPDAYKVSQFIS